MKNDIIIIGAGASGLMAAYTLVKAGKTVTVLEARNRIGGRIHTITGKGFSAPVELGAEFVHGDLPVTLRLLKEAGIGNTDVGFEMWQYHDGKFEQSEEFVEGWDAFLEKLNQLEQDVSIQEFITQNFSGQEYAKMRRQIESYVFGYDTADVNDAGAFALRNEWNHEDEEAQHRIEGGYGTMISFLADTCRNAGNDILLNTVVNKIIRESGVVNVITTNGISYKAAKVIIALPLGVLQSGEGNGAIKFNPPVKEHSAAFNSIGFGSIIKIVLEFDDVFWESDAVTKMAADLSKMGFLFTEEAIPTFWTQSPVHSPLLTGWLGGPPAYDVKDLADKAILDMALKSLQNVFKIPLRNKLVAWKVANWTADPFTLGSYAYDKVESTNARKLLQEPVEETIYFAGEYLYEGAAMGTVEAALTSGKNTAEMLLKGLV